jgi:serine/threonine-protein kinase NIM1
MSRVAPAHQGHSQVVPADINSINSLTINTVINEASLSNGGRHVNNGQAGNHQYQSKVSSSPSVEPQRDMYMTVYERATFDLNNDKRLARDVAIGKQIGFYRIREEIGSGNFSQVKLGIHILTKGSQ